MERYYFSMIKNINPKPTIDKDEAYETICFKSTDGLCTDSVQHQRQWHHQLNGHESEQTPRDSEGQGSLVCCSPWELQRVGHD